jgi:hypothetical protein
MKPRSIAEQPIASAKDARKMRRAFRQALSKMNENGGLRKLFDHAVRPEDALECLHLAAEAPTYDERQAHLEEALIRYTVGVAHQNRGWRNSRRGSKPGKRINDTEALAMMDFFAVGTGKPDGRSPGWFLKTVRG